MDLLTSTQWTSTVWIKRVLIKWSEKEKWPHPHQNTSGLAQTATQTTGHIRPDVSYKAMLTTPVGLCSIFSENCARKRDHTDWSVTVAVRIKVTGVIANYLKKVTWREGKGTWYQARSAWENLGAETEPNLQAASDPSNVKADLKVFKASFPRSLAC